MSILGYILLTIFIVVLMSSTTVWIIVQRWTGSDFWATVIAAIVFYLMFGGIGKLIIEKTI